MALSSSTLSPAAVAQHFVESGVVKHNTRADVVFLKAFIAGVFLSFGGLLSEFVADGSPGLNESNPGLVKLLSGFVFPVGLVMIILQGQELLTSNMMVMPMAALKRRVPWWAIPYNWFIVFFGNLVGSLFFAAILVRYSGVISAAPYHDALIKGAVAKAITPQWHQIFLRGIGCNWLVCIAVWQAAASTEVISKIFATWIPIWVFVACSYDHANMYGIPVAIMLGAPFTAADYIKKSLFAAFFGNIIGALFVALPFTYFYLSDYSGGGLRGVEEGEALNPISKKTSAPSSMSA
ncbi:hypothetical protein M422DRAFT_27178 [Sphaerobolus stellatus SS14]|nr:hypothetical protein M422DRAFT_27178 [Sphaerobolus stellatus SS14]